MSTWFRASGSTLLTFAPLGAALQAMLSITLGASVAKGLFPLVGPAGTTALRLVIAAVILSVWLHAWRVRPTRRTVGTILLYGASIGAMNLLFYMAIQRIPLGIALAIEFIGPLTVAVCLSRGKTDFLWVALALVGLWLLMPTSASGQVDPCGLALALGAGAFWGCYIVAGKRAGADLGGAAPALGTIAAALMVLPFGIAEAGSGLLDPAIAVSALGVAILSGAIPISLEMYALRRLPTRSFGILTSGEPAVGAVVGLLLLGELLPLAQWVGIAAIILASVGTILGGTCRSADTPGPSGQ